MRTNSCGILPFVVFSCRSLNDAKRCRQTELFSAEDPRPPWKFTLLVQGPLQAEFRARTQAHPHPSCSFWPKQGCGFRTSGRFATWFDLGEPCAKQCRRDFFSAAGKHDLRLKRVVLGDLIVRSDLPWHDVQISGQRCLCISGLGIDKLNTMLSGAQCMGLSEVHAAST